MRRPQRSRLALAAFPVLAVAAFLLLVALGWNGSSSGIIRTHVEGPGPDPQRVLGGYNSIRSDEWIVISPLVVAQDNDGYKRVSADAFGGMDVSAFSAVPYRDWSVSFRPQFWGYLVLPLQQAFAFAWWAPLLVLALGAYALVLALCPARPGMAAGAATALCFAPFVQWWFLTITIGSLGWAAVLIAAFVALDRARHPWLRAALVTGIAYATAAFLMVLYPAFQIACAWVVLATVVGWTFRASRRPLRPRLNSLAHAAAGATAGAALFVAFLASRWEVVRLQAESAYPGNRMMPTGRGNLAWLFSGFLDDRLRPAMELGPTLGTNASEASSFVFVGLFLVVPALWLLPRARRDRLDVDGLLVALLATMALFFVVLFVPHADLLAKVTLLSQAAPQRLFIGLGLLSFVLAAALVRECERQEVRPPWTVVAGAAALAFAVHAYAARSIQRVVPAWTGTTARWLLLALVVAALVALAARGHGATAMVGLALFSVAATMWVNPVYDGVYDTRRTEVGRAVAAADAADPGGWVSLGSAHNLPVLAEQPVLRYAGTSLYPIFGAWQDLDPTGAHRGVFNRYATIAFTQDADAPPLALTSADNVVVRFDGCGTFAQRRLRHVLSDEPLSDPCVRQQRTVATPGTTFYIYDVVPQR